MTPIIALDFKTLQDCKEFLKNFDECEKPFVKVGMWLYFAGGNDFVRELKAQGFKVFLDLKLLDIPNTIYSACKELFKLEIDILSIHSSAGYAGMSAAVRAKTECKSECKIFAISALTSFDKVEFEQEFEQNLDNFVANRVKFAKKAGVDGIVSSVFESNISKEQGLLSLCPGIRFLNSNTDDQSRVATPKLALEKQIDFIVVGRIITKSKNVLETYQKIIKGAENE